jgi:hypothetical protein
MCYVIQFEQFRVHDAQFKCFQDKPMKRKDIRTKLIYQ